MGHTSIQVVMGSNPFGSTALPVPIFLSNAYQNRPLTQVQLCQFSIKGHAKVYLKPLQDYITEHRIGKIHT